MSFFNEVYRPIAFQFSCLIPFTLKFVLLCSRIYMIKSYLRQFYLIPWTIWCGFWFFFLTGICFIFVFVLLLFNNQKCYQLAHECPTICTKSILFLWAIRVRQLGLEHFDAKKQYIFTGNHRSMLDALIVCGYIPNAKKFIGKAELVKIPFVGYILKKIYIPVNRSNIESRIWSKQQLISKMKEGFSMVLFPEGTCNTSEEPLMEFKDGAFETSYYTQTAIVPFVIDKADKLWHRTIWLVRPGSIIISFLPQEPPRKKDGVELEEMQSTVRNNMLSEYLKLQKA